jgi:hypothetical protein
MSSEWEDDSYQICELTVADKRHRLFIDHKIQGKCKTLRFTLSSPIFRRFVRNSLFPYKPFWFF